MPSTQKTPSNKRKKVTASARARISTRKVSRQSTKHLNESYLQQSTPSIVSMVPQAANPDPTVGKEDPSATIIAMLNKLSESNQALLTRVESIEQRQNVDRVHTNQISGSASTGQREPGLALDGMLAGARTQEAHHRAMAAQGESRVSFPTLSGTQTHPQGIVAGLGDHPVSQATIRSDIQSDGVIPTLQALRRAPSIATSVSQLLESYEEQARTSLQGRQARKSGRYNTTDIVYTTPEYRWPNEGYHAPAGKKKVAYDDLTLPQ